MRSRERSKWRDLRAAWSWSWIWSGAAVLIFILGYAWLQMRMPAAAEDTCRDRYAHARTATDTALVDDELFGRRGGTGWSCGMLRRAGATESTRH
jgi:hypothetical protein